MAFAVALMCDVPLFVAASLAKVVKHWPTDLSSGPGLTPR